MSGPAGDPVRRLETQACIVGGGPAGMMLGLLLARAGVTVTVLEKHADFLRDFRGDTVHPSTLEIMYELGLLERFLQRPHDQTDQLSGQIGDVQVRLADFRHLPTHARFIAFMPQWEFLDFIAGEAKRYPEFQLLMRTEATGLLEGADGVTGVTAEGPEGPLAIDAALVVACDGRGSAIRAAAELEVEDLGAPMDVLWMRLPRRPDDPAMPLGRIDAGRILVMIARGDYFQCAFVVAKGRDAEIREAGLPAFRQSIADMVPSMADRVDALASWDEVKLLTVAVDRLKRWAKPGLVCIGDAAHAMSPIGGVGINLAIQDAVAAANLLAAPLAAGRPSLAALEAVQRRREPPMRLVQGAQLFLQKRMIAPVLATRGAPPVPWPARLLDAWPWLRRIPARLIGLGPRPEHVRTPDVHVRGGTS